MKRILFTTAIIGLLFAGCGKKDNEPTLDPEIPTSWFDGKITAVVENGNAYNSIVSKVVSRAEIGPPEEWANLTSGNYSNGGFTLTLPATPDSKFLHKINYWSWDWVGVTYSDQNAKICFADNDGDISAYTSNNVWVDYLYYGKFGETSLTLVGFCYTDRDVTIIGSGEERDEDWTSTSNYSMSLKKGWNLVYITIVESENSENVEYSTKSVDGVKWYFWKDLYDDDDDYYSVSKKVKKTPKRNAKRPHFDR
jgi:hypothetical protein